jgi:hypothetical protein
MKETPTVDADFDSDHAVETVTAGRIGNRR